MQNAGSRTFFVCLTSDVWDFTTQMKGSEVLKSEIMQYLNKSTRFVGITCLQLNIPCVMSSIVTSKDMLKS